MLFSTIERAIKLSKSMTGLTDIKSKLNETTHRMQKVTVPDKISDKLLENGNSAMNISIVPSKFSQSR